MKLNDWHMLKLPNKPVKVILVGKIGRELNRDFYSPFQILVKGQYHRKFADRKKLKTDHEVRNKYDWPIDLSS